MIMSTLISTLFDASKAFLHGYLTENVYMENLHVSFIILLLMQFASSTRLYTDSNKHQGLGSLVLAIGYWNSIFFHPSLTLHCFYIANKVGPCMSSSMWMTSSSQALTRMPFLNSSLTSRNRLQSKISTPCTSS
jgi:hypothetical protein